LRILLPFSEFHLVVLIAPYEYYVWINWPRPHELEAKQFISQRERNIENQIGNRDEDLINPRPKGDESHIETGFRKNPLDRHSSLVDRRGDFPFCS